MLSVGLEATIPAGERPQTHALDHAAIGIGLPRYCTVLLTFSALLKVTEVTPVTFAC
jgi:hypothetical protein